VNRVLQEAVAERPVPGGGHLKYATQVSAGPPTFVLFGARAPDAAYQRFLQGRLRRAFGFDGVPIRLRFRAPKGRARDERH
jgi:GTP-binding protein